MAISLGQMLPHAQVLVVTTPQRAAADVAERAAEVARQTGQQVLGVVENMAGLAQPDGSILELFGAGGGDEAARRLDVPLLARIPLSVALREGGDAGAPVVAHRADGPRRGGDHRARRGAPRHAPDRGPRPPPVPGVTRARARAVTSARERSLPQVSGHSRG